jgi:hypothetical protein
MPQNQTRNKISAFIGITLLISIIGFTVFINLVPPKDEVEELVEEKPLKPFTQNDLTKFWKLDSINTETGNVSEKDQQHSIYVSKKIKIVSSSEGIKYDKQGNKIWVVNTIDKKYDFGVLNFKTSMSNTANKPVTFESFKIQYCKIEKEYLFMNEVGNLFITYQIKSTVSDSQYGNFTSIHLRDGRIVILLKENVEIRDDYYKGIIKNADFVNDSTKVINPLKAREVYNEFYGNKPIKRKKQKKEWYKKLLKLI